MPWTLSSHEQLRCSSIAITVSVTAPHKEPALTHWISRALITLTLTTTLTACGSSGPTAPTDTSSAAVTLSASPNPATSSVCSGCGAGSTDREVQTTLTVQETAGGALTITGVDMTLRDQATTGVIASGTFDGSALVQLSGTSKVVARGTLTIRCSVHYPAAQVGRA